MSAELIDALTTLKYRYVVSYGEEDALREAMHFRYGSAHLVDTPPHLILPWIAERVSEIKNHFAYQKYVYLLDLAIRALTFQFSYRDSAKTTLLSMRQTLDDTLRLKPTQSDFLTQFESNMKVLMTLDTLLLPNGKVHWMYYILLQAALRYHFLRDNTNVNIKARVC